MKTRVVIARFDDDSDTVEVTLVLRRYPSGIYGSENHVPNPDDLPADFVTALADWVHRSGSGRSLAEHRAEVAP